MSLIFKISGALVFLQYVPLRPEHILVNLLRSPGIDSQPLPNAALLINDMKKKPRENFSFVTKSAKIYHSSYSLLKQLQVAL